MFPPQSPLDVFGKYLPGTASKYIAGTLILGMIGVGTARYLNSLEGISCEFPARNIAGQVDAQLRVFGNDSVQVDIGYFDADHEANEFHKQASLTYYPNGIVRSEVRSGMGAPVLRVGKSKLEHGIQKAIDEHHK